MDATTTITITIIIQASKQDSVQQDEAITHTEPHGEVSRLGFLCDGDGAPSISITHRC